MTLFVAFFYNACFFQNCATINSTYINYYRFHPDSVFVVLVEFFSVQDELIQLHLQSIFPFPRYREYNHKLRQEIVRGFLFVEFPRFSGFGDASFLKNKQLVSTILSVDKKKKTIQTQRILRSAISSRENFMLSLYKFYCVIVVIINKTRQM